MAEMGGTVERTVSIRKVVNAASNVVTTAATGNIQSWATNGELGYSGDGGLATAAFRECGCNTLSLRTRGCLNSYKC